jgi:WD40 repeat protein/predicted Ser/Thr protein kinase
MPECPSPEALERALLGAAGAAPGGAGEPGGAGGAGGASAGAGVAAIEAHMKLCARCAEAARTVRENAVFMAGAGLLLREVASPAASRTPPEQILPGFRLVREIARGGQGVVYEGVQIQTKRRVAIKTIDTGASGQRRLEREAEIAAGLRHPNIVTIYHGELLADGRYALAMEFVEGVTLDVWARELDTGTPASREAQKDAVRAKVRVMAVVCEAVQHAHLRGVIHRDIKPGNVLVEEDGTPRVVDFGIARRVEHGATMTRAGGFAGTLAYASPEQVSTKGDQVDTRSDVYALGLLAYEVLTGRRPYDTDGSLTGAISNITQREPAPLGVLSPGAQPAGAELEAVIRKALSKEREGRYQSAAAFGQDLVNWLNGWPVEARQQSAWYALRKAAARHRAAFAAAVGFVLVLSVFAALMTWSSRSLATQRGLLAGALSSSTIERGRLMGLTGGNRQAEALIWPELARAGADPGDSGLLFRGDPLAMQAAWALTELYSRYPGLMAQPSVPRAASAVFEDRDRRVRVMGLDGGQELIELETGRVLEQHPPCIDPPGDHVLMFRGEPWALVNRRQGPRVVDLASGRAEALPPGAPGDAELLVFNRDRSRAASVRRGVAELWATAPWRPLRTLLNEISPVAQISFSSDGTRVSTAKGSTVYLWDAADGRELGAWTVPEKVWAEAVRPVVICTRLSPDGKVLAASIHTQVVLFPADRPGAEPLSYASQRGYINWVAFSGDSTRLMSTGSDRVFRLWDARGNPLPGGYEQSMLLRGFPVLSEDGELAAFCDVGDLVRVFESRPRRWFRRLEGMENTVSMVLVDAGGQRLLATCADGTVRAWALGDRRALWVQQPGQTAMVALAISSDGRHIAAAGEGGEITILDASSGAVRRRLASPDAFVSWVGFTPDGRWLLSACGDGLIRRFSWPGLEPGDPIGTRGGRVIEAAFGQDGTTLYSVDLAGTLSAWAIDSGRLVFKTEAVGLPTRTVAVSPDGRVVVTGSDDWRIRLFDAKTGELQNTISGPRQHLFSLVFHPQGRVLFSSSRDPLIQAWDVQTGRELATLESHTGMVMSLALSPDGRTLFSASADRSVGVWDLTYYQRHIRGNAPAWLTPGSDGRAGREVSKTER